MLGYNEMGTQETVTISKLFYNLKNQGMHYKEVKN